MEIVNNGELHPLAIPLAVPYSKGTLPPATTGFLSVEVEVQEVPEEVESLPAPSFASTLDAIGAICACNQLEAGLKRFQDGLQKTDPSAKLSEARDRAGHALAALRRFSAGGQL